MDVTTNCEFATSPTFSLGTAPHSTATDLATDAAESLKTYAARLEKLVHENGEAKAGDVPLRLMFAVLRAREQIRTDVSVIRRGRP